MAQANDDFVSKLLRALTSLAPSPADAVDVVCKSTEQKLLTCNIENIVAMGCKNATLECGNISTSTTVLCDTDESIALITKMIEERVKNNPAARKKVFENMGVTDNGGDIGTYISTHIRASCTSNISTRQSIDLPEIILTDCSQVNITAINRLDTNTRCSVGTASRLLNGVEGDSTSPPGPTPQRQPEKETGLSMPVIVAIVAGSVILLFIIVYFLMRHNKQQASSPPTPTATA